MMAVWGHTGFCAGKPGIGNGARGSYKSRQDHREMPHNVAVDAGGLQV